MDMNLLKYRAFVATVEDGSFTRAAHHRVLPAGQKERFACGEALSGISRFSRRKNSTAMRESSKKLKKVGTKFCGMCRISLEKLDILPNK